MENLPNSNFNGKQMENELEKKYNYVYFNFKHEKNKQYKISLSSYYTSDTLELIEEKDLVYTVNVSLIVKIYRFKIIPDLLKKKNDNKEFEIDVIFEEENKAKCHYAINFKDDDRDFYEYKLKLEEINILPLELDEQFEIYSDILKNKYKKSQKTKENEDFILSSLLVLKEEDNKYDLLFYLLIFLHNFATDFVQNHILAFDPKKIKEVGETQERRLKPIKNEINHYVKNPEKIHIKDENFRLEITKLFYSLALYFNLKFQKEKVKEMFENENICEYLYEKLSSYREFFKGLILPKKDIINLIKRAKKYEQILTLLFYLGTDICVFLELIKETGFYIYKFQKEDMYKNNDSRIDIEIYVEPKIEDNLDLILSFLEGFKNLIWLVNEEMILIKYSSLIIEKYSEFYDEINLDKLFSLKAIVELIKQIDQRFDCKINLDEKIHRTGLKLIKNGKIKNMEILQYIKRDIYFKYKDYNNKIYRPLEILDGIDISLIEDKNEFFKEWDTINFFSIYELQQEDFLIKIASLINEMKNFGYLFRFYKTEQEYPRKAVIKSLQNRFLEILPTYNNINCPNFIKDVVELIYLSDKNKVDIKNFLYEIIEQKFKVKTINDIYINLIENHKDLSKEFDKITLTIFNKYQGNPDPIILAYLIDKCRNLGDDLLSKINNYILKEDDIFL